MISAAPNGSAAALPIAARAALRHGPGMQEIIRCNDPVLLSFVRATLEEEEIACLVVDGNMSVLEGSLGILAARVLVPDDDAERARRVLGERGLSHELRSAAP